MGQRKKPKKYSKMNYQQKEMYVKDQIKELGGEAVYYLDSGGRGSASTGMFDLEESQEVLQKLANNDYDRRESLKYGVDSGDKRFKDLNPSEGFNSMNALVNTDRAINKYGYNQLGHKNMSSDADYAAVSNSLFNKSRDKFAESIRPDIPAEAPVEQANPRAEDLEPFDFEYSDKVQGAKDRIDKYESDVRSGVSIFNKDNIRPVSSDDQAAATDSFLDIYKADLLDAANLKENKARNLNNAMDTVASYRSKFMS